MCVWLLFTCSASSVVVYLFNFKLRRSIVMLPLHRLRLGNRLLEDWVEESGNVRWRNVLHNRLSNRLVGVFVFVIHHVVCSFQELLLFCIPLLYQVGVVLSSPIKAFSCFPIYIIGIFHPLPPPFLPPFLRFCKSSRKSLWRKELRLDTPPRRRNSLCTNHLRRELAR